MERAINPVSVEIPSKIKSIYIELPGYQFQHGAAENFKFFIGRERMRERLRMVLLNAGDNPGGAYLVAGYRGMGKSSLVEFVIQDINNKYTEKMKPKWKYANISIPGLFNKINISLSQDDVRDIDVLKFFATQLYRSWESIFFDISQISGQFSGQVKREINIINERLKWLDERLNSVVKTAVTNKTKIDFLKDFTNKELKNKEIIRSESLPKEIEKELIYLLNLLNKVRSNEEVSQVYTIPQFLFVIDELDKIEPSYLYDINSKKQESPTQMDLDNTFGINKVRRRQEVIMRLLANLKSFLNTAKAKFIFIGGREMYDAALADIADRDSFYGSIFHDVIYVNSFFKDHFEGTRSGVTRLTESYLIKLLLPEKYVEGYYLSTLGNPQENTKITVPEELYNLNTYYHYLIDIYRHNKRNSKQYRLAKMEMIDYPASEADNKSKEEMDIIYENKKATKNTIYKIIFFLQNTIFFLTYRSTGTPKKLVALIESFIVNLDSDLQSRRHGHILIECPENLKENKKLKNKLFLHFSYNQQYEIGLTTNIYRPYVLIHSRHLKSLGDKLLYSTAYIMDYIMKYHPHGFSWRNLELIPEIILVNKDPNLRYFISDIMKFLSGMHIRETTNSMFMYKFYTKQANEIRLLTKISEPASAAFNFTLDESLHIIRYYRRKLDYLKLAHPNYNEEFIHSIGFIQGILGDLYYFEREYDEAIIYYADSVQVMRRLAQQEPHKMTKHQCVLYVRNKLLLGLCLEKIKAFDSAYSIYRGLILNIPRLLDKVIDAEADPVLPQTPGSMGDEWDKPIRRMQLFIKPHIALLDLIEKQRMDGITYANLSRNFKEVFDFLVDSSQSKEPLVAIGKGIISQKKMDSVRVALLMSDYYANVGSLLFFKNKNFPELHELLNHYKLTQASTANLFKFIHDRKGGGPYNPSLSAFTYYYMALRELVESYSPQLEAIKNTAENTKRISYQESDNAFNKTLYLIYPECIGIVNNIILYNFANLLTRIADTLLASLSEKSFRPYAVQKQTLYLFGDKKNNEIQQGEVVVIDEIKNIFEETKKSKLQERPRKNGEDTNDQTRCQLASSCDINFILALYRLSGLFYMKSGRTYSYAFQYKKFLFVLKDYLLCVDSKQFDHIFNGYKNNDNLKQEIYADISAICENVAERIFNTVTWVSDVANRPQILKYREIFSSPDKNYDSEETRVIYLNLSTSPEIRETIVLVEEIKLKVRRKLGINQETKSHITSYDLLTSRFARVLELRYQSEVNYNYLQRKNIDILFKSPILSDLSDLHILNGANTLTDLVSAIEKITIEQYKTKQNVNSKKSKPSKQTGIKPTEVKPDTQKIIKILQPFGETSERRVKIRNIENHISQKIQLIWGKAENKEVDLKNINFKEYLPEIFMLASKDLEMILKDEKIKEIICDSIFCLFEVIRTLNLYGLNYISNYSFLANMHFKLANWCEISRNLDVLNKFSSMNEPSEVNQAKTLKDTLKSVIGEESTYYLEANYHNELAIQHYHSALQAHSGGNAYKSINQSMSFLEDDFNDNLTHFSAASERFRINTGLVNKRIDALKRKLEFSNVYVYDNYVDK